MGKNAVDLWCTSAFINSQAGVLSSVFAAQTWSLALTHVYFPLDWPSQFCNPNTASPTLSRSLPGGIFVCHCRGGTGVKWFTCAPGFLEQLHHKFLGFSCVRQWQIQITPGLGNNEDLPCTGQSHRDDSPVHENLRNRRRLCLSSSWAVVSSVKWECKSYLAVWGCELARQNIQFSPILPKKGKKGAGGKVKPCAVCLSQVQQHNACNGGCEKGLFHWFPPSVFPGPWNHVEQNNVRLYLGRLHIIILCSHFLNRTILETFIRSNVHFWPKCELFPKRYLVSYEKKCPPCPLAWLLKSKPTLSDN